MTIDPPASPSETTTSTTNDPFIVEHQRVFLTVHPLERQITGTTEISISIRDFCGEIKTFALNTRSSKIFAVKIDGLDVPHDFSPSFLSPTAEDLANDLGNPARHPNALSSRFRDLVNSVTNRELIVQVPSFKKKFMLFIEYAISEPSVGVSFLTKGNQLFQVHVDPAPLFSDPSQSLARLWVPCREEVAPIHGWDLHFNVSLKGVPDYLASSVHTISSGNLKSTNFDLSSCSKQFHFNLDYPVLPGKIAFAMGTFAVLKVPFSTFVTLYCPITSDHFNEFSQKSDDSSIAFCTPREKSLLEPSADYLSQVSDYPAWLLSNNFRPENDTTSNNQMNIINEPLRIVFLKDPPLVPGAFAVGSNVAFANCSSLHDSSIIEQTLVTRHMLCSIVAAQFFGIRIIPETKSDRWLICGLQRHLASSMFRLLHGSIEDRTQLYEDINLVVKAESVAPRPALTHCHDFGFEQYFSSRVSSVESEIFGDSLEEDFSQWAEIKARLVIHALENRIEKAALQRVLSQLCADLLCSSSTTVDISPRDSMPLKSNETLISASASEILLSKQVKKSISTMEFIRLAQRISGKDLQAFSEQWIYKSGCPHFSCTYTFNRKRSVLEVDFKQWTSNWENHRVVGNLLFRVHEKDGVYDHAVHIDDFSHHFELPVHSRSKKIKRKKRDNSLLIDGPASLSALAQGTGMKGAVLLAEKNVEESAEAPQNEEDIYTSPLAWIRLDPEMDWIASLEIEQSEQMLIEQLRADRDAVSQLEAISTLRRLPPTLHLVEALEAAVGDARFFHRVRRAAAFALSSLETSVPNDPRLERHPPPLRLVTFYNRNYALQSPGAVVVPVPRPNDFSDLQSYFCLRSLCRAMGKICTSGPSLMELVGQIILNLLRFNDNSANILTSCSDNYHISALVDAATSHLRMRKTLGLALERISREYLKEFDRFASLEVVRPSYHNTVMTAILRAWGQMHELGLLPDTFNLDRIRFLFGSGNFFLVRIHALDLLLKLSKIPNVDLIVEFLRESFHTRSFFCNFASAHSKGLLKIISKINVNIYKEIVVPLIHDIKILSRILSGLLPALISPDPEDIRFGLPLEEVKPLPDEAAVTPMEMRVDVASTVVEAPRISLKFTIPINGSIIEATSKTPLDGVSADAPLQESESGFSPIKLKFSALVKNEKGNNNLGTNLLHENLSKVYHQIWENPLSFPFRYPVDPSVPGYYTLIKHPMDLSVIGERLKNCGYPTLEHFCDYLRLIFDNCFYYNLPESAIYAQARNLRAFAFNQLKTVFSTQVEVIKNFLMTDESQIVLPTVTSSSQDSSLMVNKVGTNVETPKSPIKRIIVTTSRAKNQSPSKRSVAVSKKNTKKFKKSISKPEGTLSDRMTLVLNEMCNHPHAFWFLDPVDPVALGIPSYPEIVREPMDLSTIRSLLNGGSFENDPVEFGRLLDLIFTNSTLFNPPSTLVHQNSLEMRRDAAKILKRLIPEAITNTVSSKEL